MTAGYWWRPLAEPARVWTRRAGLRRIESGSEPPARCRFGASDPWSLTTLGDPWSLVRESWARPILTDRDGSEHNVAPANTCCHSGELEWSCQLRWRMVFPQCLHLVQACAMWRTPPAASCNGHEVTVELVQAQGNTRSVVPPAAIDVGLMGSVGRLGGLSRSLEDAVHPLLQVGSHRRQAGQVPEVRVAGGGIEDVVGVPAVPGQQVAPVSHGCGEAGVEDRVGLALLASSCAGQLRAASFRPRRLDADPFCCGSCLVPARAEVGRHLRVFVTGAELGGGLQVNLAVRVGGPSLLEGTVLVDPPLSGPGRGAYPTTLDAFLGQLDQARRGTDADEVAQSWPRWPRREQELRARWLSSCSRTAIAATHAGFESEDFFTDWPKVPAPTVLVYGGDSPVVTAAGAAEAAEANPSAELVEVPDAGPYGLLGPVEN
jgi:hypothetical protein